MPKTVLSPIAISVRDQAIPAVRAADLDRVGAVCREMLEVNASEIPLGSNEMRAVVAAVVEGILAAFGSSREQVVEATMHAIARFASSRDGSDPRIVAAVICDAATIIEVPDDDQQSYLDAMIEAALAACDHLLGPEREELAAFLRVTLPGFIQKRDGSARPQPNPLDREDG